MKIWQELRRRRVFRLAGIYVVGAWLVIQIADVFFPAWGITETAVRYLIVAAALGLPVALVFGWFFDITAHGIVRTSPATAADDRPRPLRRADYLILAAIAVVAVAILFDSFSRVRDAAELGDVIAAGEPKPANSIAVLPFNDLNGDPDVAYFSDGISEEILHKLSSTRLLQVLGRASSFGFKGSTVPIPRISDILNVRYLLQGSVRREANQIRITAQLLDEKGFQVWSETYDREMAGVFAIQSEIASAVAGELVAQIGTTNTKRGGMTNNVEAYQEYLLGRDFMHRRSPDWQQHARDAFSRAIELDPDYAAPYAGLAIAQAINSHFDADTYVAVNQAAQANIDKALQLDPELADAHAAQGLLLLGESVAENVAAEAALRRAIAADPNYMNAYNWLAISLASQGKYAERKKVQQAALAIDPLNPIINANMAMELSASGDFRGAERLHLRLMELPTPPGTAYFSLISLYQDFGRLAEAHEWIKRTLKLFSTPGDISLLPQISYNYQRLGMPEEADYYMAILVEQDGQTFTTMMRASYLQKLRGEYSEMAADLDAMLAARNMTIEDLPLFAAEVAGAMYTFGGQLEKGIAVLENRLDMEDVLSSGYGGSGQAAEFLMVLAYGYRKTGEEEKAMEILRNIDQYYDQVIDKSDGLHPSSLIQRAMNKAMLGEVDRAARLMESAVDSGWRDYYHVKNDPLWHPYLELPQFKSTMSWVLADIERQRERIIQADAEDGFRAYVDQLVSQ